MKFNRLIWTMRILMLLAIWLLMGCATATEPNIPAQVNSLIFETLAAKNPLLAEELKKLPEIQDGISSSDVAALNILVETYNEDPVAFDKVFEQMYKVGLPEFRKYCSPLQAYFWIIGESQKPHHYIQYYSLDNLLGAAWIFPDNDIKMTEKEFNNVINGIVDPDFKDYINGLMEMEIYACIQRYIIEKYSAIKKHNLKPEVFTKEAEKIIKSTKRRETAVKDSRWQDFDKVVVRLNAPELVQFWINRNMNYKKDGSNTGISCAQPPRTTLLKRTGDGEDHATFAAYCLSENGYESKVVVKHPFNGEGHAVGAYKYENKYYRIGDTRHPKIKGPYNSYQALGAAMDTKRGKVHIRLINDAIMRQFNDNAH